MTSGEPGSLYKAFRLFFFDIGRGKRDAQKK
jgi:hypothetical protein